MVDGKRREAAPGGENPNIPPRGGTMSAPPPSLGQGDPTHPWRAEGHDPVTPAPYPSSRSSGPQTASTSAICAAVRFSTWRPIRREWSST